MTQAQFVRMLTFWVSGVIVGIFAAAVVKLAGSPMPYLGTVFAMAFGYFVGAELESWRKAKPESR